MYFIIKFLFDSSAVWNIQKNMYCNCPRQTTCFLSLLSSEAIAALLVHWSGSCNTLWSLLVYVLACPLNCMFLRKRWYVIQLSTSLVLYLKRRAWPVGAWCWNESVKWSRHIGVDKEVSGFGLNEWLR